MRVSYRGHEIDAHREQSLGSSVLLYYSIFRESDGYCCVESFEDSDETVADMVEYLRQRVDAELLEADPWEEKAGA